MNQDMVTLIAPLTLVLGAGLFAAGLLSFLEIHFFKNKFAERAALAGGLALILLTEMIFAASGMSTRFLNGQRSDLLECRLTAETALPNERHKNSPLIHERIVRCMDGFGYEWTTVHERCKQEPVSINPFCYLPSQSFDRVVTQVLMMFE
jgi:hypothetical protein